MKQLKNYILEGLFDDNKTDSISNRFALEKAIANKDIQEYGGGYYGPVFDYDVNDNTISIGKCHNWHDYIIFNKDFDLSNAKSLNISSYGLCFYQDKPMTRKWLPENIVLNSTEYSDSKTIIRTDIIGPFDYKTKCGYLTIGEKNIKLMK
jgi:hypothetical protein